MLGHEVHLPGEIAFVTPELEGESYGTFIQNLCERMTKAHATTRKNLQKKTKVQQQRYDSKITTHQFAKGDYVWFLNEARKEGVSPKLQSPYLGPFIIIQVYNKIDYRIQMDKQRHQKLVHYNKLKPYNGISIPSWMTSLHKILTK